MTNITPEKFSPTTYSHIGVFVENLEEAVEAYTKMLNIRFRPPVISPLNGVEQPGVEETAEAVRFAYSIDGPPYYELIEMTGTGVYSRERNVPGIHHVAVFMDEADMLHEIKKENSSVVATFWSPDGSPRACYVAPSAPSHIRVEYLNQNLRPRFEHLWSTGKLPA